MRRQEAMRPRRVPRFVIPALIISMGGACTGPAAAQESGPPVQGHTSFLEILWQGAELPGAIIILMSVAAVAMILDQLRTVRHRAIFDLTEADSARRLIEARQFKSCVGELQNSRTMFAAVMVAALRQGRHGFEAMQRAAEDCAAAWTSRMFRRVEYLNILGNLGPLMGLLGTVLGMIRAFSKMQETHGVYKPEDLAGGIALALVNTLLGLALAVIALGFFGVFRNRVDALTVAASAAAMDLIEFFRPTASSAASPPSRMSRLATEAAAVRAAAEISTPA